MKVILYLFIILGTLYSDKNITILGNSYKPPKIWTEDNIHKGILVEILQEIQKELDVKFDIQTYPWARAYKMASNNIAGIVGISKNKQREKIFDFNKVPLFLDTMILVTKKGKEFKFDNIKDLEGKKIAYCRGCSFGKTFEEAKKYFTAVETDDNREQRLMLLLYGKIDAALLGPGEYALKSICEDSEMLNTKMFTILKKPLTVDPNYLAFSKKLNKKDLLKKIDKVLQKKINEKVIEKIINNAMNGK